MVVTRTQPDQFILPLDGSYHGVDHCFNVVATREFAGSCPSTGERSPLNAVNCRLCAPALLMLACLLTLSPLAQAATRHNVLVLYSHARLLPANIEAERALAEVLATRPDFAVVEYVEFLDSPRFSGEAYERAFVTYLREKYASHPPEVIIAAADEALDFMLRYRAELFAQVPVVHLAVSSTFWI